MRPIFVLEWHKHREIDHTALNAMKVTYGGPRERRAFRNTNGLQEAANPIWTQAPLTARVKSGGGVRRAVQGQTLGDLEKGGTKGKERRKRRKKMVAKSWMRGVKKEPGKVPGGV